MEFLPFSYFILHIGSWFAPPCLLHLGHHAGLRRGVEQALSGHCLSALFSPPAFQGHHALGVPVCPHLTSSHADIQITGSHTGLKQSCSNKCLFGPQALKCLDIYSSAWMLSTERALCVAELGKAAASPKALFWRCTILLPCQMAQYSALLSLTGASSATMLIFILPAAFYLRLVEKEPLRSPQKIGVRELAAITKQRMGGCVLSTGHKFSALWLAAPGSWSQIVVSHPKHRSDSEIQLSGEPGLTSQRL